VFRIFTYPDVYYYPQQQASCRTGFPFLVVHSLVHTVRHPKTYTLLNFGMGVDHGETGGTSPPHNLEPGAANANCLPPDFCHIDTKMSVPWPSKYAKIRFRPGLCPGPGWGSSRRSPRPLSRLERGHPSPYPTPLGTDPPSALAMRPPRSAARSTPMNFRQQIHHHHVTAWASLHWHTARVLLRVGSGASKKLSMCACFVYSVSWLDVIGGN